MKVLIADDEAYMLDYMSRITDWRQYGFDLVLTANGGSLARDLLEEHRPELLITDVKMPRVSGLDLARYVSEKGYATRIIIISGYSEFDYAQQAIRYGVKDYLVKPVLKEDFEKMLLRVLEKEFGMGMGKEAEGGNEQGDVIRQVKKYVEENCGQALSLDILSEAVHLHPAYLSRIFKEATGENLSGYITDVKMQKAAELLEKTDLKIYEVMKKVGYQKSQYFSGLFKEKYGKTPREYRAAKWRS